MPKKPDRVWKPWVVKDIGKLEQKILDAERAGKRWEGYKESTSGKTFCATLPMSWDYGRGTPIGPLRNPRENWHMGESLILGDNIERGTVIATFNRETGIYENRPSGNHAAIFLSWYVDKGWFWNTYGIWVIEQGPNWPPRARKIPFASRAKYSNDAGRFNVVEICPNNPPKP